MALLFGDSVKLLENHHIYSSVCDLVAEAEDEIIIVSPYVDPTENLLRDLRRKAAGEVSVELVFRLDKLEEYRTKKWLAELLDSQVQLGTVDLLHSKLYFSEREAILTSMNLLNSSKDKSHEVGINVRVISHGPSAGTPSSQGWRPHGFRSARTLASAAKEQENGTCNGARRT